jgi:hypothetical protein
MKTALVVLATVSLAVSLAVLPAAACVGARALSMGGAFTGLADDVSATYWNPAALVDLDVKQGAVTWMHTANNRDTINYQDYVGAAVKVGTSGALGASWLWFKMGLDAGVVDDQNWYWVSASTKVGPKTSLGANVKFADDRVNVLGASVDTDTAFDVALYHHASDNVTVGLLVQNVNEPKTTGYIPGLGSDTATHIRNWRPGMAVRLPDHVILSAEVYNATNEDDARAFRFGAEKKFLPTKPDSGQLGFALRAGWYGDADAFTVGAGIFGRNASADAALMMGDLDNTWLVSASTAF